MSEPALEPVSYRILEEVCAALRLVTVARGFYTDLGLAPVVTEFAQLPEEDGLCTLVVGTDLPVDEEASTRTTIKSSQSIVIEVSVPFVDVADAQLQAHRARIDVMRALIPLRKDHRSRPLGVSNFGLTGSGIQQPVEGASTIIVQVSARAGLSESISPAI